MHPGNRCDGFRRRDILRIGGLTALGMGLGDFFGIQARATADTLPARAKSCILIWLDGGPSHLETFDPKPNAPEEIRGPFASIATSVSGIRINECFEHTAGLMNHLTVIRSMTSPLGEHNFGTHYLMTGYRPTPAIEYPTYGAVCTELRGQTGDLPGHIAVPKFSRNITGNGFLPQSTAPFSVGGNPDRPNFRVRDLDFFQGLDLARLDRRRQMVAAFDAFADQQAVSTANTNPELERAFRLIASKEAKQAFDLTEEPAGVRERYGRGSGSGIGQSCLLARRLVERGVPFVTVNSTGWDTHQKLGQLKSRFPNDRNAHLPALDRAMSALIEDLAQRGLLDETLVIVMGEFGRTPKVNVSGGRDHWPNVFSVLLAGAKIPGGQCLGSSDSLGEQPRDLPITPADLAATIYTLLGIDPRTEIQTPDGRPIRIAPDDSQVVPQIIG